MKNNTPYYVYLAGNVDPFNFNAINPSTNRPWAPGDDGAAANYDVSVDFRLRPFLSEKAPDHGRLSEQWPGYYARHIGQVRTDDNGRFINAADLSAIRQPTLNPIYFDGLAEATFTPRTEAEFFITRVRGTSGIVMVAGEAVQTYEQSSPLVHRIRNSDLVQAYNESALTEPLSNLNPVAQYPGENLYLYLANSRAFWGVFANKLFVSNQPPTSGYLSRNWPGNQARWIATLRPDQYGRFTGSFLPESVASVTITLDDADASTNKVWSSSRVNEALTAINTLVTGLSEMIGAQVVWANQREHGIQARLNRVNSTQIRLAPTGGIEIQVSFPDLTTGMLPGEGLDLTVSGSPYTLMRTAR